MEGQPLPHPPKLIDTADLHVEVGEPIALGRSKDGLRRIVPIFGGTIAGDGWSGAVLAAGADFQVIGEPVMMTSPDTSGLKTEISAISCGGRRSRRAGRPVGRR
jgi:hypothetical protein